MGVLTFKCAVICHCSARYKLSDVCTLSALFVLVQNTVTYVTYFLLRKGLWVRMARKACWLAYCKIPADVVEYPGTTGILHFTYYVLGHAKSFSAILNSRVLWVSEGRAHHCTGPKTPRDPPVRAGWRAEVKESLGPLMRLLPLQPDHG